MKDRISALMDGELDERAAAEQIAACGRGGEAREAWRTYHLIGDAMRDTRVLSAGFSARVAERLAAEPTVLAPQRAARPSRAPGSRCRRRRASPRWRWSAGSPSRRSAEVAPMAQAPKPPAEAPGAGHCAERGERLSARAPGLLAARLPAGHGALRAHRVRAGPGAAQVMLGPGAGHCRPSCAPGSAQAQTPEALDWLRKIHDATQKLSYTGTFVYQQRHAQRDLAHHALRRRRRRHRAGRGAGRRAARDRAHARHGALLPARQPRGESRAPGRPAARARLPGAAARAHHRARAPLRHQRSARRSASPASTAAP